jgi:hypothetical protein
MTAPSESYLKVQYDLRPAKQVERRMLLDGLQKLMVAGFDISEYQYTGFGSIHFVDFVMFHKLLGMNDLLSVEHSFAIERRVKFNRPFKDVRIRMGAMADVIPTFSQDKRHVVWLDYDNILDADQLRDIYACAARLSRGSVLLVTVDIEPPLKSDSPRRWRDYFADVAGTFLSPRPLKEYKHSGLARINLEALESAITRGLVGRDVSWLPLFWFVYADGHRMLTMGGMIGGDQERRSIRASQLSHTMYARLNWHAEQPFLIEVPRITRKERVILDTHMPCDDSWQPADFELSAEEVRAYRQIYRFYPPYAELLL